MKTIISSEDIQKRIIELGVEITEYYRGKPLTVIAVLNGAMIFCSDLVREIKLPLYLDSVAVSSYRNLQSSGNIDFRYAAKMDVKDRHVLVVDDIHDTGLTMDGILKFFASKGALSVECCCLLNKKDVVKKAPLPKWNGFDIPEVYVVGYGLDADEEYRNIPDICDFNG